MLNLLIDEIIENAIKEDITDEDISTECIYKEDVDAEVELIAKEDGIIAGLDVYKRVFEIISKSYGREVQFEEFVCDGDEVKNKDLLMKIKSTVKILLSSERVALNLLQRMSGIATYANKMVKALDDCNIKVVDTRKTTPGLRILEKYAVRLGGAYNHRYNLSDAVMLKDNHISAAGGVKEAIYKAKKYTSFTKKIEIETENLDMVREAIDAGADIIMLDNMNLEEIKKAINIINKKALIEVSGNISLENINRFKGMKIDIISSGAITHSAGILDLSMKNLKIR